MRAKRHHVATATLSGDVIIIIKRKSGQVRRCNYGSGKCQKRSKRFYSTHRSITG
jgi:hypothetical protein